MSFQTTLALFRRAYIDPDADALAGAVRHFSHLAAAVVHVGHAVAIGALFPRFLVAGLTTLHRVLARRRRGISGAALGLLPTDGRANHDARRGGRIATMAMTDLVTEHATDQCAEDGATSNAVRQNTRTVGMFVNAGFIPAGALRRGDSNPGDQRLHVDDACVVVRTIAIIVTTLVMFVVTLIAVVLIVWSLIVAALGGC